MDPARRWRGRSVCRPATMLAVARRSDGGESGRVKSKQLVPITIADALR
jgi:hypothetical protein